MFFGFSRWMWPSLSISLRLLYQSPHTSVARLSLLRGFTALTVYHLRFGKDRWYFRPLHYRKSRLLYCPARWCQQLASQQPLRMIPPSNSGHAAGGVNSVRGDSHDKTVSTSKTLQTAFPPEFRSEALKLAGTHRCTSAQPVNSACMNHNSTTGGSKQQNQQTSSERELRCLPRLHVSKRQSRVNGMKSWLSSKGRDISGRSAWNEVMSLLKTSGWVQHQSNVPRAPAWPAAAGIRGVSGGQG